MAKIKKFNAISTVKESPKQTKPYKKDNLPQTLEVRKLHEVKANIEAKKILDENTYLYSVFRSSIKNVGRGKSSEKEEFIRFMAAIKKQQKPIEPQIDKKEPVKFNDPDDGFKIRRERYRSVYRSFYKRPPKSGVPTEDYTSPMFLWQEHGDRIRSGEFKGGDLKREDPELYASLESYIKISSRRDDLDKTSMKEFFRTPQINVRSGFADLILDTKINELEQQLS